MITAFQESKEVLLATFGLSRDAMHIHIGLIVYFALHLGLRRAIGAFLPLILLLAACLAGEVLDLAFITGEGHPVKWLANIHDIWNTMFWPCLFTIYGRWGPKRQKGRRG